MKIAAASGGVDRCDAWKTEQLYSRSRHPDAQSREESKHLPREDKTSSIASRRARNGLSRRSWQSCLGGRLEIALACHYRIAVNDKKTQLAVPEVMLGLMPGAGGTQNVLNLTLTGKKIKADKAKKIGIVDQVIQPLGDGLGPAAQNTHKYLEEVAVQAAKDLASGKLKINRDKGFMHKASLL